MWATLLCCPHIHRLSHARRTAALRHRWARVRICSISRAGTTPTSTAKSRIGAVPHTVLGTHAGAVFHPLRISSMSGFGRTGGGDGPAVSVHTLPGPGADLQPLRPRPDLLRVRLRAAGPAPCATGGRPDATRR